MKRHRLRKRYGHSGGGYVEAKLAPSGREWRVAFRRGAEATVLATPRARSEAINLGQREAKARGVPFIMGI